MTENQKLREAFEAYITDNGKWPNAILKAPGGQYLLLRTSVAWQDWRACAEALAPAPAQEPVAWLVSLPNEPELGEWFSEKDMGELGYTSKPLYTSPQEVGLTGPAVAWRMRDTGFRRPKYVYFDTKEQAVAHAAHLLQSRDDGHLTELTPLCEASTSTDLLDALRDNSWKLEPFEIPTGQGDADIGWRVVGFYMGKPKERTEATVYTDDPAAAIIAALRAKGQS